MDKSKRKTGKNGSEVKKHKLDELDLRIVGELRENCKQSWRKLAKKLGVSPVTITNRVKALEKNGVVEGYSARVDYSKLGFEFCAWVGFNIPGTRYQHVANELLEMPEIESIYAVTGDFDIAALFRARNRDEFYKTVQRLYRMEDVRTKTYFAVALKENYFTTRNVQGFKP